jgi:hypothetical protein
MVISAWIPSTVDDSKTPMSKGLPLKIAGRFCQPKRLQGRNVSITPTDVLEKCGQLPQPLLQA